MTSVTSSHTIAQDLATGEFDAAEQVPKRSYHRRLVLVLGTSAGLLIVSLGYALGWDARQGPALSLFFLGISIIFATSAWQLLGLHAERQERIMASVALVLGLTVAAFLTSPLLFTGYDELLHQASLWQWEAHRGILAHNSLLPISRDYPGLEAFTLGLRWLTGLPLVLCEMTAILVSRLILVLAIFLVVERLTDSSRAAGAGVVAYSASPQFYAFNAAFAYQTLALALGAGCIYILLRGIDHRRRSLDDTATRWRWFWISTACCIGTVVTHHLIGWMTVGLLVAWFLALAMPWKRRPAGARLVGTVAGIGLLAASLWTWLNRNILVHYLRPILDTALNGFLGLFRGHRRTLFQGAGTFKTPQWEQAVMLGSALAISILLAVGVWAVLSGRTSLRGGPLRWIPVLVAAGYGIVLLSRLATTSAEVGGRLSTFVFFGIAIVVGAWYAGLGRKVWLPAVVAVASICFLGGLLLGSGPDLLYVPGPYAGPSTDQRSIDATSLAAARWAATNLPADSIVAADRDNAALMAAIGHLSPESEGSGGINVGPLYFAREWGAADTAAVRREHIRYLVVDQRLATGPPTFGAYFDFGETTGRDRLTSAELAKFADIAGMQRIYDNGPLQIYDLAGLLQVPSSQPPASTRQTEPGGSPNWPLIAAAVVVILLWARRWWYLPAEDLLVRVLAATLCIMGCAVVIFYLPAQANTWLYLTCLSIFAVPCVLTTGRHALTQWRDPVVGPDHADGASTAHSSWHIPGRYLLVVLATASLTGSAIYIAAKSEAVAWRAPTSLAVHEDASARITVEVHLAGKSGPAELLFQDGPAVTHWWIPGGRMSWSVLLPTPPAHGASGNGSGRVTLLEGGRAVRAVSELAR